MPWRAVRPSKPASEQVRLQQGSQEEEGLQECAPPSSHTRRLCSDSSRPGLLGFRGRPCRDRPSHTHQSAKIFSHSLLLRSRSRGRIAGRWMPDLAVWPSLPRAPVLHRVSESIPSRKKTLNSHLYGRPQPDHVHSQGEPTRPHAWQTPQQGPSTQGHRGPAVGSPQ